MRGIVQLVCKVEKKEAYVSKAVEKKNCKLECLLCIAACVNLHKINAADKTLILSFCFKRSMVKLIIQLNK